MLPAHVVTNMVLRILPESYSQGLIIQQMKNRVAKCSNAPIRHDQTSFTVSDILG